VLLLGAAIADKCNDKCIAKSKVQGMTNEAVISKYCKFKCDKKTAKQALKKLGDSNEETQSYNKHITHITDLYNGYMSKAKRCTVNSSTASKALPTNQKSIPNLAPSIQDYLRSMMLGI